MPVLGWEELGWELGVLGEDLARLGPAPSPPTRHLRCGASNCFAVRCCERTTCPDSCYKWVPLPPLLSKAFLSPLLSKALCYFFLSPLLCQTSDFGHESFPLPPLQTHCYNLGSGAPNFDLARNILAGHDWFCRVPPFQSLTLAAWQIRHCSLCCSHFFAFG